MTKRAALVFVVETPRQGIDISKAGIYGDIIYLFGENCRRPSIFQTELFGNAILQRLKQFGYDPDIDSFCVAGSMLAVSIALISISQTFSKFNILMFNSTQSEYTLKRFNHEDWR